MSKWDKHVTHAFFQVIGENVGRGGDASARAVPDSRSLEPPLWVDTNPSILWVHSWSPEDVPLLLWLLPARPCCSILPVKIYPKGWVQRYIPVIQVLQ